MLTETYITYTHTLWHLTPPLLSLLLHEPLADFLIIVIDTQLRAHGRVETHALRGLGLAEPVIQVWVKRPDLVLGRRAVLVTQRQDLTLKVGVVSDGPPAESG